MIRKFRRVLRVLWYYTIPIMAYEFVSYKSTVLMLVTDILAPLLTYYFLGSSIVYQRGIADYGTSSPVLFLLSGILLGRMVNPFRYSFALHLGSFYQAYSSPIPPWLILLRDWIAIFLRYILPPTLVYALTLAALGGISADPLALALFIPLWILMNVGLN